MPGSLPAHHSPGTQPRAGQHCHPLLPGPKSQLAWLGRGRCWRRKGNGMGKGMGRGGCAPCSMWLAAKLQQEMGAFLRALLNLGAPAMPVWGEKVGLTGPRATATYPPQAECPRVHQGMARRQGLWWCLSQPRVPRLSITVIPSSCSRSMGCCHGIAPSSQAVGDQGQLFWAAQDTPAVVLCAAQGTGAGTWVLPPLH